MEEKMPPFMMKREVQSVKKNKEDTFAELLAEKIKSLSNPERRTHVLCVLRGSDGNYYYGENHDQCLVDLKDRLEDMNIKEMVVHAEMDALRHVDNPDDLVGSTIYVYREHHDGKFGMCRPCKACMAAIKKSGIKTIIYTSRDGICKEVLV